MNRTVESTDVELCRQEQLRDAAGQRLIREIMEYVGMDGDEWDAMLARQPEEIRDSLRRLRSVFRPAHPGLGIWYDAFRQRPSMLATEPSETPQR